MLLRRRFLSATGRALTFSFCAALASSTLGASQSMEAVLDRGGDPNWVGAFLLDGPKEAAKPLLTLPRGERVRVWPARGEDGYLYVERLGPGGKVTRTGFVHRKFLKFSQEPAAKSATASAAAPTAPATVAPAAKTASAPAADKAATPTKPMTPSLVSTAKPSPEKPAAIATAASSTTAALQTKLEALEARLEEMNRRLTALERDGIPDPGVDFLQRLQKLEMEVHSRDTSALPTVPFPEVPRQDSSDAPASAASRIPGVSWLLGSW